MTDRRRSVASPFAPMQGQSPEQSRGRRLLEYQIRLAIEQQDAARRKAMRKRYDAAAGIELEP